MTATPRRVLRAIEARDGHVCAWHGESCGTDTLVPQHRQGGMGGSRTKHRLSNVIWLCSLQNGLIESDPAEATAARDRGIKISQHTDPCLVPVDFPDGLFWLTDDGRRVRDDEVSGPDKVPF